MRSRASASLNKAKHFNKQKMSYDRNQVSLPRVNIHTTGWNKQYISGLLTDSVETTKSTTVFHNKMFTDAYENNWLDALAIYLMLFKRYPNKQILFEKDGKNKKLQIIAKELGVSKNTLISKIKVLQKQGLVKCFDYKIGKTITSSIIKLASNKQISEKYNCLKFGLYINMNNVDTYKKIKYFLKNIPFLSNLSTQRDRCKYHEYFSNIRQEIDLNGSVDYKTYKALLKYEKSMKTLPKKKVKNKGLLPNLSLNGIARVTNRKSNNTAQRYKNFLVENKVVATYRRTEKLCNVESMEHFEYMKHEEKSIPKHALYSKQNKIAYVYNSSLFFVTTDKWSMETMDDYYDKNLKEHVEDSISQRNVFLDMLRNAKKYNAGTLSQMDRKSVVDDHGRNADIISIKMAELLSNGYSNASLWYGSQIHYSRTNRNGVGRDNCTLTKSYSFNGIITDGVQIGSVDKRPVKNNIDS